MTTQPRDPRADNALKHGLFTTQNCVQAEELPEYNRILEALWESLAPAAPLEELFAMEIVRATWRLRRCVMVEANLAQLSAARSGEGEAAPRDPMLCGNLAPQQIAVDRARAQAHSVLRRATAELQRLQTARAAAAEQTVVPPAAPAKTEITKQNSAPAPAPDLTPRGAPCPCNSGLKYKRCCGAGAPAVLGPERANPHLPRAA